jgi:hypothetical protein
VRLSASTEPLPGGAVVQQRTFGEGEEVFTCVQCKQRYGLAIIIIIFFYFIDILKWRMISSLMPVNFTSSFLIGILLDSYSIFSASNVGISGNYFLLDVLASLPSLFSTSASNYARKDLPACCGSEAPCKKGPHRAKHHCDYRYAGLEQVLKDLLSSADCIDIYGEVSDNALNEEETSQKSRQGTIDS